MKQPETIYVLATDFIYQGKSQYNLNKPANEIDWHIPGYNHSMQQEEEYVGNTLDKLVRTKYGNSYFLELRGYDKNHFIEHNTTFKDAVFDARKMQKNLDPKVNPVYIIEFRFDRDGYIAEKMHKIPGKAHKKAKSGPDIDNLDMER